MIGESLGRMRSRRVIQVSLSVGVRLRQTTGRAAIIQSFVENNLSVGSRLRLLCELVKRTLSRQTIETED